MDFQIGVLPQQLYERIELEVIVKNINDNLHFFQSESYELSLSGLHSKIED